MATRISTQLESPQDSHQGMPRAVGPRVSIFAVPKPFVGHVGVIQRNALRSWKALGEAVEVILFGDEVGTAQFAAEMGFRHVSGVKCNSQGTPLLDDVFASAHRVARGKTLLYANSDIILVSDLLAALDDINATGLDKYLVIGRRIDVDIDSMIDFEAADWETKIKRQTADQGRLAAVVCKDYFAFPKTMFQQIPAFAIGRGNWDNWMVHDTRSRGVPVIDATRQLTAIHQNHDYGHLANGRLEAYVNGAEAESNRALAGGRHLISGCAATWRLEEGQIRKLKRFRAATFLSDIPRFGRLLSQLFVRSRAKQAVSRAPARACSECLDSSSSVDDSIPAS